MNEEESKYNAIRLFLNTKFKKNYVININYLNKTMSLGTNKLHNNAIRLILDEYNIQYYQYNITNEESIKYISRYIFDSDLFISLIEQVIYSDE